MSEQYATHKFDAEVADVYGIVAAILFQYIAWRSNESPTRWISFTLDELCKQYPYLTKDQIRLALHVLTNSGRRTPALVLRKGMRGKSYMYSAICRDFKQEGLHYFDIALATRLGVVPAIIFQNVEHWITENWDRAAKEVYPYLDPVKFDDDWDRMQRWAYVNTEKAAAHWCRIDEWGDKHSYVSRRSAYRGFSCLLEVGLLTRSHVRNRLPLWGFTEKLRQKYIDKWIQDNKLDDSSAKTPHSVPKPHTQCQNTTHSAKTPQELPLSHSSPSRNQSVPSSIKEAAVARSASVKLLEENYDAFEPPALANARVGQPEGRRSGASRRPPVDRSVLKKIAGLNRPNLPVCKSTGVATKRPYHRKLKPQGDYDLNYDELK